MVGAEVGVALVGSGVGVVGAGVGVAEVGAGVGVSLGVSAACEAAADIPTIPPASTEAAVTDTTACERERAMRGSHLH